MVSAGIQGDRMTYALSFYLDPETLGKHCSLEEANAYVRQTLMSLKFTRLHGDLYLGDPNVSPVQCVLAAQKMKALYPWFKSSVREFKMLRVEDINDMGPALE